MSIDSDQIKIRFRRRATRFYLVNIAVVLVLAVFLYSASANNYRTVFISVTLLFLVWLFNARRLLRCPACEKTVHSNEGLIRMPLECNHCRAKLR